MINWNTFFFLIFCYRCAMTVFATTVVGGLTSLGDSGLYTYAARFDLAETIDVFINRPRQISTIVTMNIGWVFRTIGLGYDFAGHLGFQTMAFVGIVIFLRSIEPKLRLILAVLICLPSFTLWSSLAGKEAVVVFAVAIVCEYVVRLYDGEVRPKLRHIAAVILIALMKFWYLPAVFCLLGALIAGRYVRQKGVLAFMVVGVSLIVLFLAKDRIVQTALDVPHHFEVTGLTLIQRQSPWDGPDDVFWKAPWGMFQSFAGPTLDEAKAGVVQMAAFIESAIIITVLLGFLVLQGLRLPVFSLIVGAVALAWILFLTYPLGIMNAGSAIRYRTGYEILVFTCFVIVLSRQSYVTWLSRTVPRSDPDPPPAPASP